MRSVKLGITAGCPGAPTRGMTVGCPIPTLLSGLTEVASRSNKPAGQGGDYSRTSRVISGAVSMLISRPLMLDK